VLDHLKHLKSEERPATQTLEVGQHENQKDPLNLQLNLWLVMDKSSGYIPLGFTLKPPNQGRLKRYWNAAAIRHRDNSFVKLLQHSQST